MERPLLMVSLGALGVAMLGGGSVAACLVFDGRVATEPDDASVVDGANAGDRDTQGGDDAGSVGDGEIGCGTGVTCPAVLRCCAKPGANGAWSYPVDDAGRNVPCQSVCAPFYGYACDGPQDCVEGYLCCAHRKDPTNVAFTFSLCETAGSCVPANVLGRPLCQPDNAGDAALCPSGLRCVASDASDLPPGYHECM
jgi:hypothetical protein